MKLVSYSTTILVMSVALVIIGAPAQTVDKDYWPVPGELIISFQNKTSTVIHFANEKPVSIYESLNKMFDKHPSVILRTS